MGDISTSDLKVAERFSEKRQDVWSLINETAAFCNIQPVVNMSQGFFGYNPPVFIRDAAKIAVDRFDCNQYAPTKGRLRLREALSKTYSPLWGRCLDPATEFVVTTGANEGILSILMAFINPGDEVIVFEPYFDQYLDNIRMPGGIMKCVPLHPPKNGTTETCSSSNWSIDFAELERTITPQTKMIILNSPHNPTGKILSKSELQRIGDLCVKHEVMIISDEVYDRLDYVSFTRIATLSHEIQRRTLTVGSVGKHFCCTGWRVGWVIGPASLIDHIANAHLRICYCTPGPFQEAAAVAYEESLLNGYWSTTRAEMRVRMDRFCEIFRELDIPYSDPEGGYFVLANMAKVQMPADYHFPSHIASRRRDFQLAYFLIMELGIAAIPPTEFYSAEHEHLGENYMRFAVCKNDSVLDLAKERLRGLRPYIMR